MKVWTEISSLDQFEAWSGGKDTLDDLTVEQRDRVFDLLEEMFPEGAEDSEINDFLWFDRQAIYEHLGLDENGEDPNAFEETSYKLTGFDGDTLIVNCEDKDDYDSMVSDCDDYNLAYEETDEMWDKSAYAVDYEVDLAPLINPVYRVTYKTAERYIYLEGPDDKTDMLKLTDEGFSCVKINPKDYAAINEVLRRNGDDIYDVSWSEFDWEEMKETEEVMTNDLKTTL